MMRSPVSFAIETAAAGEEAILSLQARFSTRIEPAPPVRLAYYDSFDWRLYRNGSTLVASAVEGGLILTWRSAETASALRLRSPEVPAFAWDFPHGPFQDELARLIEMRRLLPVVAVETEGRLLRILDAQRKTVARAVLQRGRAEDPAAAHRVQTLPAMLRVLPVRGYDNQHEIVLRFVEASMGLARVEESELRLALACIDREPGDYSSKLRLELEPDMPAKEATGLILRTLLGTIEANEEGVRRDLDSEFLHDFRVAVRRTRSALRQIKGVYPPEVVDKFSDEFRWLGQITGPTRDLDVYLLKMADYGVTLPAQVVEELEPLVHFLRQRQEIEQRRMRCSLGEDRYRSLMSSWRELLERPAAAAAEYPNAGRPIREVASEHIWKAYCGVRAKGLAIQPDTPAVALHRLRIACKKLRYLLEFFRSLYDAEQTERLIRTLKQLQDNLGDFNDYEIQQVKLGTFAEQMVESGTTPAKTLMAMGRLIERLEAGQAEERQRLAERFGQFSAKKNHARFKRLFKTTRGTATAAPETAVVAVPRPEAPAAIAPESEAPAAAAPEPEARAVSSDPAAETTTERQDQH